MITETFETVSVIIILIGMGMLVSHLGWYKKEDKNFLSKLILNIGIPAVTVKTFFVSFSRELLLNSGKYIFISILAILLSCLLAIIFARILRLEGDRKLSFVSMITLANGMFVGYPVNVSIFGDEAIPYVLIYYLANNLIFWSLFVPKFKKEDKDPNKNSIFENIKGIFSLPLITMFISYILVLLDFKLPEFALEVVSHLGGISTPLSLMFIGGVIYEGGIKSLKVDKSMIYLLVLRFIASPIIMALVAIFFGVDGTSLKVLIMLSGMPVMTQLGVVGASYGSDREYISAGVSITTIVSLFFIPIYMIVMNKLF